MSHPAVNRSGLSLSPGYRTQLLVGLTLVGSLCGVSLLFAPYGPVHVVAGAALTFALPGLIFAYGLAPKWLDDEEMFIVLALAFSLILALGIGLLLAAVAHIARGPAALLWITSCLLLGGGGIIRHRFSLRRFPVARLIELHPVTEEARD